MLSSCSRNLLNDITLTIDDSSMNFYIGSGNDDEEYFYPQDSALVRQEVLSDLTNYFNEKGNDVTIVSNGGNYTLRILSCGFYEYFSNTTVSDPCDTIPPYDTLHYEVHSLRVRMRCIVKDSAGHYSEIVEAESSDEEEVKDHPTFFQRLVGHDECYCPRIKNIHFVDKLKRRVVRRIHKRAMSQIKSWQRMKW